MTTLALLLSLLACGSAPCPSYVAAYNDCYKTHDPNSNKRLEGNYCADYSAASDDYFTCLAERYESGDCTTDSGIAEIDAAVAECSL